MQMTVLQNSVTARSLAKGKMPLTPERLMQLAWGYAPGLILEAALDCHVFRLLHESPQSAAELARAARASVRGLTAILNALLGLGLLSRKGDRYSLTPESAAFLVPGKPAYHGGF